MVSRRTAHKPIKETEMKTRDTIINEIIRIEGGYSDNPKDSGGKTRYGVTESVARKHGYTGSMQFLPLEMAKQIYIMDYWEKVRGDNLLRVSEDLAEEIMDTAVNTGIHYAGEYLQRTLNVLNSGGSRYPDLLVDGLIGAKTISAIDSYIRSGRKLDTILKALNCLQGAKYIELAERRQKDEAFVYGWLNNRVTLPAGQ